MINPGRESWWMILIEMPWIRRKIYHLYEQKQNFTLYSFHEILQDADLFHGGRSSLASLLKDMGFDYKKINDKR